jgi:hypothetical protein
MKDLSKATYILDIKIYRDRSKDLMTLSDSTYLEKIMKRFGMDQAKKRFLPVIKGKPPSVTQGPTTNKDREMMSHITMLQS